jgi:chromosome segregation ATPase
VPGHLSEAPAQSRSPGDHPILRLEALLGELDEDDTNEAQQLFNLIRRNLEKGSDAKFLINHVNRMFVSVKQRVAGKHDRLSNEMAQIEQEMQRIAGERDRLANEVAQNEQEMQRIAENRDRLANDMAEAEQEMQRIAENRNRLSNNVAEAEQEMQLFNDMDAAADNMDIDE